MNDDSVPASACALAVPGCGHDDFCVELQHFDLSAPVIPDLPQTDAFDPMLLLWDTHEQERG